MEEKKENSVNKEKTVNKVKKTKKIKKKEKSQVNIKPVIKNVILITVALILFAYAGIISFTGKIATDSFDTTEFEKKAQEATGFIIGVDSVGYKVTPSLHGIMTVHNFSADWVGNQKLFSAKKIVIETKNPFAIFTKNFDIQKMNLVDVFYADQHLDNGENKLNSFPRGFDMRPFGKEKITVKPGDVVVKNLKITYTTPDSYNEKKLKDKVYTKQEVKAFLAQHPFVSVDIK